MAPVILELHERGHEAIVFISGQHPPTKIRDMLLSMGVYHGCKWVGEKRNVGLPAMVSGIAADVEAMIDHYRPEMVLVHGDTATCMAGALAAFHAQVKCGHVEAGLRSFDTADPWPEEGYRQMTDSICTHLFAPTGRAASNLCKCAGEIITTGNTIVDALRLMDWQNIPEQNAGSLLVTCHRRETVGRPQRRLHVVRAINHLSETREVVFVLPQNPEVAHLFTHELEPQVHTIMPMEYRDFIGHMRGAKVVLTDSGGLVEECCVMGKPVVVCRDRTERPDAFFVGVARLSGVDAERIIKAVNDRWDAPPPAPSDVYGDGFAARRIVDTLEGTIK